MYTNITVEQAFEVAMAAEKAAAALYQGLRMKFIAQAELARFWQGYALDEVEHASWLKRLRDKLPPEKLASPVDADIVDSLYAVTEFSVEQALEGVQSLEDAFQLVCEIESGETNAIIRFLLSRFEPDAQLRDFLESQLIKHIGKITLSFPV